MNYKKELKEKWWEAGGLITETTAAHILDVWPSTIHTRIEKGDLKVYMIPYIDKKTKKMKYDKLVSLTEICDLNIPKRNSKIKK